MSDFPQNAAPGDKSRYRFKGAFIDWWDWGNVHDHQDTVVRVNGTVDSQDNGRRSTLVVPASNWVDLHYLNEILVEKTRDTNKIAD